MEKRVFISHASQDQDTARRICAFLESRQTGCWIAPRDVSPGADYAEEIMAAINKTDIMVLILSAKSNLSRHVRNEVERAVSKGKAILPLRIEDITLSAGLEFFISSQQWIDAHIPPIEDKLERLGLAIVLEAGVDAGALACLLHEFLDGRLDAQLVEDG